MQSKNCRVHVVLRLSILPRLRVTHSHYALGKLDPKSWEQQSAVFVLGPIRDNARHTSYTLRSAPSLQHPMRTGVQIATQTSPASHIIRRGCT